jgi:hypothetical protein
MALAVRMWILGLAAFLSITTACTAWSLRLFRISTRDAVELAAKLNTPRPHSVREWPELRVDVVVADPETPRRLLVVARWPAHPRPRALLVLETDEAPEHVQRILVRWRDSNAVLSPTAPDRDLVELRRRKTTERLCARLVHESVASELT